MKFIIEILQTFAMAAIIYEYSQYLPVKVALLS